MKSIKNALLWLVSACLLLSVLPAMAATATTTTLTSATNPSKVGAGTLLTATVVGTAAPTGTVTFKAGSTILGTGTLTGTGNTKTATYTAVFTTVGARSLKAVYGGDGANLTSTSAAVSQSVTKAATTSTVTSSLNPSTSSASVTFTVSVTGFNPSGTVTFKDGTTTLGTGTLAGTGNTRTATLATAALSVASHSITVVYAGDTLNLTSTSAALTQVVNKKAPTVALTSSLATSAAGANVTFTATLSGGNAPTGTVTFFDGATSIGTGTIATNKATLAIATLSAGTHAITAVYAGDTNNSTATSAAFTQTVTIKTTTLAVTSSVNPTTFGGSTTLTATITGGYVPTGTITFKDGTTTIGTGTVASNKATLAIATLAAGAHSITASYSGDINNTTSTASALTQTVNIKATTTALTASPNPSLFGAAVTLTATVTGATPTGTVTFKDGAATIGTATVSAVTANKAILSFSALTVGTHSITAVYGGDTGNATSTSAAVSQVVNIKTTTTVVTASPSPSNPGNLVTLTATVTGSTPTGTVTFKDGASTLGTGTVNGAGAATFTTSALSTASHSITAVYAGDTGNATSTSAAYTHVVTTKALSTVTLSTSPSTSTYGQTVVLSASVTGAGSPTGTVTFKRGTTTIGSTTLVGGAATLSTATLPAGTSSLTAVYGGDTTFANGTSNVLAQVVSKGVSTIALQTSSNPVTVNSYAVLTATVTSATGLSVTGNVTFKDGATVLGAVPLAANSATGNFLLSAGIHSITASYAGDANNDPSVSGTLLQASTNTVNHIYQYGYDALGNPNTVIDPLQQTTNLYVDNLNRQTQIQQPPRTAAQTQPTTTSFQYDLGDNLTKVTDPRNLATNYTVDGLGQVKNLASPDSGNSGYTFDAQGNLLTKTDARGKVTTMAYDVLDRLTSITYPTGTPTTLEYDGGTSPYAGAKGELTKITDESGSQTYSYDAAGRLIAKTQTTGSKTFTVVYTWGNAGSAIDKITSITYPSGNRVNYSYGTNGQVMAVTVDSVGPNGTGLGANMSLLSAVSTNSYGAVTGWTWSNGLQNPKTYYLNGDLFTYELGFSAGAGNAAGASRLLMRDDASQITGLTHSRAGVAVPSLDQTFTYDNLGRVLTSTFGAITTQYKYDATGNRTSKIIGSTTYTNTISPSSNRLTQTQDVGGTASVQFDAAGNITADGANTFTYSDRGRMQSATNAGGAVAYKYNALELRVGKTGPSGLVPTGAAYYVYDEAGQLLGEYDANQNPIYETVYLGSSPVGVIKQTGTAGGNNIAVSLYNVYADHLATPRVITRASDNAIVWRWDTAEAFGASAPSQDPSGLGTFVYNPRFPGQVFDAESGLFDNWNRTYDARQGRYRQSDPIGLRGGINTYAYVGSSPLMSTDPRGLNPFTGAYTGAGVGSVFGPVGTVVGGVVGFGVGAWIGWNVIGPMFNESPEDAAVYPDNPDVAPDKFENIPRSPGKYCPDDGSVWERDTSGHGNRDGDGSQWKRWPNKKDWNKGRTPNSIWPDGRIRK